MQSSYPTAIKNVLAHEGGYTNHPSDPGGPTNWGITIFDARKYWKAGATAADVKAMPLSVAQSIYERRYWDAQRCDDLPAGLDYSVFDYGVNSGTGRSGKVLRRICGLPDNTSAITQEVIDAVQKRDAATLIKAMNDERMRFLKSLKTWPVFGAGWGRRVSEVKALSLKMAGSLAASTAKPITPTPASETMAKATVSPPPIKTIAGGAAVATAGTGYAAIDWILAHPYVSVAVAAIGIFVVVEIVSRVAKRQTAKAETPMPGTEVVPVAAA